MAMSYITEWLSGYPRISSRPRAHRGTRGPVAPKIPHSAKSTKASKRRWRSCRKDQRQPGTYSTEKDACECVTGEPEIRGVGTDRRHRHEKHNGNCQDKPTLHQPDADVLASRIHGDHHARRGRSGEVALVGRQTFRPRCSHLPLNVIQNDRRISRTSRRKLSRRT